MQNCPLGGSEITSRSSFYHLYFLQIYAISCSCYAWFWPLPWIPMLMCCCWSSVFYVIQFNRLFIIKWFKRTSDLSKVCNLNHHGLGALWLADNLLLRCFLLEHMYHAIFIMWYESKSICAKDIFLLTCFSCIFPVNPTWHECLHHSGMFLHENTCPE